MVNLGTILRSPIKLRYAIAILLAASGLFLVPLAGAAGQKYDDSTPFSCVPTIVIECVSTGECRPGTPQSNNLPDFFEVNLKEKTIGAEEKKRVSSIKEIDRSNNELTLYGSESGHSWILMIRENTGRMSASITGDGESFVIFGICPLL
jgi:hypothetical protein